MTQIIAIAGRKQSGKSSAQNYIFGALLKQYDLTTAWAVDDDGNLVIPSDDQSYGIYDINDPNDINLNVVWPKIRPINFSDPLKALCTTVLGLDPNCVYGDEQAKNQPTHLFWENVPESNKTGAMSVREVLQYFGTDLFRKIYPNVWCDTFIRTIQNTNPDFAIVADLRFPNELEVIKNNGGVSIYLTRKLFVDNHASETQDLDLSKFDLVVDNSNMSIDEKNIGIFKFLKHVGIFKFNIE